ncbi:MAG: TGS domain-containing protein, partial [Chloroflexota bacterium]
PMDNAQVQLVDLPPLVGGATPPWQRALLRQADVLLLLVDLSQDPLSDWTTLQDELATMRMLPVPPGAAAGEGDDAPDGGVGGAIPKKALLVGTKRDLDGAGENGELLALEVEDRLPLFAVSGTTGAGLEALRQAVFDALDVIRVYTKPPGKPPDRTKPFTLPRGSTVGDLADAIHHDLQQKLQYATLWGASSKFGGQRVGRDHALEDQDVVELHER